MRVRHGARVFTVPPGLPFLPALADGLLEGQLVPGFRFDGDPLKLADATIYVPTRRAARELRSVFVAKLGGRSAILPVIRPLGDVDEDAGLFDLAHPQLPEAAPPVAALDRLLILAPLVHAWKRRLPAHIAALFEDEVTVPASVADSIWLARDLADLMDEVETEGADWTSLAGLVPDELAAWWQVTLEFLSIVTTQWPEILRARGRSNPAAYRSAMIDAEVERLRRFPPQGPVIAAGSTGSIPATARLLSVIARHEQGALVLPGLDVNLDEEAWSLIGGPGASPSVCGHPQYGLKKLLGQVGVSRLDVVALGEPLPHLAARARLVSEALRPAETTERWAADRERVAAAAAGALDKVALVEAANERDEALAIAIALRRAIGDDDGKTAALVTGDRELARRVSAELLRFGIRADDSGGLPLASTAPAILFRLVIEAIFAPGDPVTILSLLQHPLFAPGMHRYAARAAGEAVELVALRGSAGRPDIAMLAAAFETRLAEIDAGERQPAWRSRLRDDLLDDARTLLGNLEKATMPLVALRGQGQASLTEIIRPAVEAFEAVGGGANGDLTELYRGDAGEKLADFLRSLLAAETPLRFPATEFPAIMAALVATETVKPTVTADSRVSIWGALEARLQSVDTLVIGGLNEGSWPRRAEADRFMSRLMKGGMALEPPERRIGLAAHDFMMAMGAERLVLTRAARAGDAPSVPSRWLQRLLTYAGEAATNAMRARGDELTAWAHALDEGDNVPFAARPRPQPPLEARPKHFSVTEIETLRRDPYAVYAKRVLQLRPLDPLMRDPGAADRGSLFHEILHRFVQEGIDPAAPDAGDRLLEIGEACFSEAALPDDVHAVWWPRFRKLAGNIVAWERSRAHVRRKQSEARANKVEVGATGVTLSAHADRIDLRDDGRADILDFKTGSSPTRAQANALLAPQLPLEAALLKRGAFGDVGPADPVELAYVRLKSNGQVLHESILDSRNGQRTADDLADDAWHRLELLLQYYADPGNGYLSRALPFKEGDFDGDYDHLARVLEWSAGAESEEEAGGI